MAKIDPYAALRYPEFRYFVSTQFLFTVAVLIQEIALSYYLYEITNDPLSLGLVGLFEAIPYISLALFGGYVADKYDKLKIARISFAIILGINLALIYCTNNEYQNLFSKDSHPYIIYVSVFVFGICRGFFGPAWSSLKPFLVRPEHYSNSSSWSSQFWQSGVILGPAISGFLYAYLGLTYTLCVVGILLILSFSLSFGISKKEIQNKEKGNVIESLKEGISFVFSNKILFYSIMLDMFSVLFGGVVAILPVYAKDILHVGAEGLGILRASPAIGAVLTMLLTAYFPPTNQAWRNILLAVAGFGIFTLIFALSTNFYISLIALFLTGACDSISVVIRQTILQVLPPDNMRGRVNSVNGIFVSCSNELGAFESGVAAKMFGTVNSVLFGGTMTIIVVSYIYFNSKALFKIKLNPQK